MDPVSIAMTVLSMKQSNTRQSIQTAVAKSAIEQERMIVDMIAQTAANAAPAGMGRHVNRMA
jgi:DNA-binding GntR family transcriptional regulator